MDSGAAAERHKSRASRRTPSRHGDNNQTHESEGPSGENAAVTLWIMSSWVPSGSVLPSSFIRGTKE